jgi:hypothetical protein
LNVERLSVSHASPHELGPVGDDREWILLLGKKAPQLRMVPAELVKRAVSVDADAAAKLFDLGYELLTRH